MKNKKMSAIDICEIKKTNKNYNSLNLVKFPISGGTLPDISFEYNCLIIMKNIENVKSIIVKLKKRKLQFP